MNQEPTMTNNKQLGANGRQLSNQLASAKDVKVTEHIGQYINIAGVGREVSVAYEQLRNAAEYTQEHLLIQKAIRRFYVRNLSFQNNHLSSRSVAEELIIELIQSGYVENNTLPVEIIDDLGAVIQKHYDNFWKLKVSGIKPGLDQDWTLDLLSVASEKFVTDNIVQGIFAQFTYRHYLAILNKDSFIVDKSEEANFEASLYVAIYKSLFKTDLSSVRFEMQKLYNVSDESINDYAQFHQNIDTIYASELTDKITRYIDKYGAPLRVLKNMVQENENIVDLLSNSDRFYSAYSVQIEREYNQSKSKLNRGLVKSIVFLLITKSLIGVGIEVPYDMYTVHRVDYLPLVINLLTPVVYIALLRLGLKMPGKDNTRAMQQYAENMLYGDQTQVNLYPIVKKHSYPIGFKIAYALMFLIVFWLATDLLMKAGFNIVQGGIFFIFFATANFLGFRLSRIVRELELITAKSGFLATIRDFIYMPFILLGQWLSDKYSKINIVALVLDTIIELPLKTVLRLIRQWTDFINEKKDQI
ncbi:MAG: hypothetical protein WCH58_00380 [Candidatus Saccharibacteria bacterium]